MVRFEVWDLRVRFGARVLRLGVRVSALGFRAYLEV